MQTIGMQPGDDNGGGTLHPNLVEDINRYRHELRRSHHLFACAAAGWFFRKFQCISLDMFKRPGSAA